MGSSRPAGARPMGERLPIVPRPKTYRPTVAERVFALIRQGHALSDIAAREGMPTLDTLQRWSTENAAFRTQYERTRQFQSDILADQVVAMADLITLADSEGLKLRIEARKWRVAMIRKDRPAPGAPAAEPSDDTVARLQRALDRIRTAPPVPGPEAFTLDNERSETGSEQDR